MAKRRVRPESKDRLRQREARRQEARNQRQMQRQRMLEQLEDRRVMAGAQLIGVQPSDGDALSLTGLSTLHIAPQQLTLRFDESQAFAAAITGGVRVSRAGPDLLLGTTDDIVITPGFVGANPSPNENEVVIRFKETLPDDVYRVEIFGKDLPAQGIVGLRNLANELFAPKDPNADSQQIDFRLDLGAKVISVVPQPITRKADGKLDQQRDTIWVFFNNDDLDPVTAQDPSFYQLILTHDTARNTDDEVFLPTSVTYDPSRDLAILKFSNDLHALTPQLAVEGAGTFRLRIGTDVNVVDPTYSTPVTLEDFGQDAKGPGAPDNDFSIDLRFPDGQFTARQQQVIREAADRWEQIIKGDLPDEGLIDDIEITVLAEPVDGVGHYLARGFPTNLRPDSNLPYQGKIVIDLYDLIDRDALEAGGPGQDLGTTANAVSDLKTTVLREIGKVLGFGSLWPEHGLITGISTVDPRYTGANALREYNTAFNIADFSIPVENTNDAQGATTPFNEQWREQFFEPVLRDELMSGYLSDPRADYISRITIGAMEDLGYVVDYNAADVYNYAQPTPRTATPYVPTPPAVGSADPGDTFDSSQVLGAAFDTGPALQVMAPDTSTFVDGSTITLVDSTGRSQVFEFVDAAAANGQLNPLAIPLNYDSSLPTSRGAFVAELVGKINGVAPFDIKATTDPRDNTRVLLTGDQSVTVGGTVVGVVKAVPPSNSVLIHSSLDPTYFAFDMPGGIDEPGQRITQFEEQTRGDDQDFRDEITTIYYNFKSHYGYDIAGNPLSNVITNTQKQRAREVFELYGRYLGVQFVETASQGITIATGDLRAVRPTVPTGPGDALGIAGGSIAIMDGAEQWNDEYGGNWFQEAMKQIGQVLGLGWSFNDPAGNILGSGSDLSIDIVNQSRVEPVFPGAQDLVAGKLLYRPQQKDIDLYSFVIQESGTFVAETLAERLANSSALNTVLTLYRVATDENGAVVLDHNGVAVRELVARNDDYFSDDSLIKLDLDPGTYFIGVSASGNENYNPGISDSGFGGTSEGKYDLRLTFTPQAGRSIQDLTRTPLDGDADNVPGGVYDFWFRVAAPLEVATNTPQTPAIIYVDKSNQPPVGQPAPNGELGNPFNTIPQALAFITAKRASAPETPYIIRLVGNGGADGRLDTLTDNIPYELGFKPPFNTVLPDGRSLDVPAGVTVMIDSGVVFKSRLSSINVGSESPNVDRSGGAVQVLGTPYAIADAAANPLLVGGQRVDGSVYFTSWNDESIGADTNPNAPQTAVAGDWGGLLFRTDQERVEARFNYVDEAIFLNYVNHADIRFGGGKVVINSVQQLVTPIHLIEARPTLSYNRISRSAAGAISADPNSFEESNFHDTKTQFRGAYTSDYERVGPDIHDNTLSGNSTNALVVRIDTLAGGATVPLTVSARFDDTDIPHVVTENLLIQGTPGGAYLEQVAPPTALITFSKPPLGPITGALDPLKTYEYRIVFIDAAGNESPPSAIRTSTTTPSTQGLLQLNNLPVVPPGTSFVGRRIYRREVGGPQFLLVDQINGSSTVYTDRGKMGHGVLDESITTVSGIRRARLDASLVIDPGTVVKIEGSRIETGVSAQLIAEGRDGREVIFTSRADDRFGGSGTFDTNNDATQTVKATPRAGDWGGLIFGPASNASLDQVLVTFGGGIGKIGGSFAAFNAIEIHQADQVRIANSEIRNNEIGQGGQAGGPQSDRFGQGFNAPAAIFVRGSQPIIVNNIIADNVDTNRVDPFNQVEVAAISVDVNSLNSVQVFDPGRSTGRLDAYDQYRDNRGPLVRLNRMSGNALNSLDIRGGVLSTEGVWDDTDIIHTLRAQVFIPDFQTYGGLRLQSSSDQSLVVKLLSLDPGGNNPSVPDVAGIVATGNQLDNPQRIGGMLHVIGQPGRPVVLTSIHDDTTGAGFRPDGTFQVDVEDNGTAVAPQPGDWQSLRIDQYSNDRNVDMQIETFERSDTAAPGINATPATAQYLGALAENLQSGDETLRLGFVVNGFLNDPRDIDVYSFNAAAGTEVWIDIDRTTQSLDTVIELVDAVGTVIARSDNSLAERLGTEAIFEDNPPGADIVQANALQKSLYGAKDHWTLNPRDAGMRIVLPGNVTPGGPQATYFVRVRSSNPGISAADPALLNGTTFGVYQLQIRLSEVDELPGSTVRFADIRYATTGVEVIGGPSHSPLGGEAIQILNAGQTLDALNDTLGANPSLGNLLEQDRATISIAGTLGLPSRPGFAGDPGFNDVDFYRFDVLVPNVREITDNNSGGEPLTITGDRRHVPVVFDIDYADGFSRANTRLSVFDSAGRLILVGDNSNISQDRPQPLNASDVDNLAAGSIGSLDAFIGPVELPEGTYFVAVSPISRIPTVLLHTQQANSALPNLLEIPRLEPIDSVARIFDEDFDIRGGYAQSIDFGDNVDVQTDKYLPDTTTQLETTNFVDQTSNSNVHDVQQRVAVDDTSAVPYELGNVVAYAIQPNNGSTTIFTFDPFTGQTETSISVGRTINDLYIPDRNIRAFTVADGGGTNDAYTGNFLTIDSGNGAILSNVDDGIATFVHNATLPPGGNEEAAPIGAAADGVGYDFRAMTQIGGVWYAVGDRNDRENGFVEYGENVLYRFNADGTATSAPSGNRPSGGQHRDAGTNIVERGHLITATRIDNFIPTATAGGQLLTVSIRDPATGALISFSIVVGAMETTQSQAGRLAALINADARINPYFNAQVISVSDLPLGRRGVLELDFIASGDGGGFRSPTAITVAGGLSKGTGFGPGGTITGIASFGQRMYLVSDNGGLWFIPSPAEGTNRDYTDTLSARMTFVANVQDEAGTQIPFGGLTDGPSTEDGRYADLLFGSGGGRLYAFNPEPTANGITMPGQLEPVFFDHQYSVPIPADAGIAFSTLQENPWGFGSLPGCPIGGGTPQCNAYTQSYDNARDPLVPIVPTTRQYGIGGTDFAGGAVGTMETNSFSLVGYSAADQPMMYLDYWLDSQGAPDSFTTFLDSFRIFITSDGQNWSLLSSNNAFEKSLRDAFEIRDEFDNTAFWRQLRIPLGDFAGLDHLRLRFDLATAGEVQNADDPAGRYVLNVGDEVRVLAGNQLRDQQSLRLLNVDEGLAPRTSTDTGPVDYLAVNTVDRFEFDMGYTLVAPSGSKLHDGDTFTIDGVVYEWDDDDLDGIRGNLWGNGIAGTSNVLLPFQIDMTAERVAELMQAAIEKNYVPKIVNAGVVNDSGRELGWDPIAGGGVLTPTTNDTFASAVDTGLRFGAGTYNVTAQIGDNPVLNSLTTAERFLFPDKDSADDVDIYRFEVTEHTSISARLTSGNFRLQLLDDEGNVLRSATGVGANLTYQDGEPRQNRAAPQHSDAQAPREIDPDQLVSLIVEPGVYFVSVASGGFDPQVDFTGSGTTTGAYGLRITLANSHTPNVSAPAAPPAGQRLVYGDDLLPTADIPYTYVSTIRDGNRINIPDARSITSPLFAAAAPNTPFARFIEGTPGVFPGTIFPPVSPNIPVHVHAGMSAADAADALSYALADIYTGGDRRLVKGYKDTVDLVGHAVIANDLGQLGNNPGAIGQTKLGVTGAWNGQILPGDEFTGTFYSATRAQNNTNTRVFIDNLIIGFAERGEMVVDAPATSATFSPNNDTTANEIVDGSYQLEIRPGAEYGASIFDTFTAKPQANPSTDQSLAIYRSFDTNARLSSDVSLVAVPGSQLHDTQTFTLSDGVNTLTFEFDDLDLAQTRPAAAGVAGGNVLVGFRDFEPADLIAERIRDAINSPQAQAVLKITAGLSDGTVTGLASTSSIVNLFGNVVGGLVANSQISLDLDADNSAGLLGRSFQTSWTAPGPIPVADIDLTITGAATLAAATIRLEEAYDGTDVERLTVNTTGTPIQALYDATRGVLELTGIATVAEYQTVLATVRYDNLAIRPTPGARRLIFNVADTVHTSAPATTYITVGTGGGFAPIVGEYDAYDFGEIDTIVSGVLQRRQVESFRTEPDGTTESVVTQQNIEQRFLGDENTVRDQGQILIFSNTITNSSRYGVEVLPGDRDQPFVPTPPGALPNNPHQGPVRNLDELNVDGLVPGPVISNNVLAFNGLGGVLFSGDNVTGQVAPVPFGRIVNNTIYGPGQGPTGIGINVINNAGPTLLNNIVAHSATGVRVDASSLGTTVLSGMLYQGNGGNIGGALSTLGDFAITLTGADPLFVNGPAGNFYLAAGSQAIDSSVAALDDRLEMVQVRDPLGISLSPIQAPDRDVTGQLRVKDGTVSNPSGPSPDTNIDRGAFDRSDTSGPTAILVNPFDNDGDGLDIDRSGSVVFRPTGVFTEFAIQLVDGLSVGAQVDGVGIDDATVIGATLTITQDGRFLAQGIDYTYNYDATSDKIVVKPLAGIWQTDSVYVITLNNRDRHVVTAPDGAAVMDGDQFHIRDTNGADVVFEYESGYTLQLPQTLTLVVPPTGGGIGGVRDGEAFQLQNGPNTVVFEFDSNNNLSDITRIRIPFSPLDTADVVANAIVTAVAGQAALLGLSPSNLGGGQVHVGGTANHALTLLGDGGGNISLVSVGSPVAIKDGDTFTIDPPNQAPVTFEFSLDANVIPGNVRVPFRLADPRDRIADTLVTVIGAAGLSLDPINLGNGEVHIGGLPATVVDVASNSSLTLAGLPGVTSNLRLQVPLAGGGPGGVGDIQMFQVIHNGVPTTFEFDTNNTSTAGNRIISINTGSTFTQDQVADAIVVALASAGLGLSPANLGNGLVEVGGGVLDQVTILTANLTLSGVPGGAVPVTFVPHPSFASEDMALSILDAIDQAKAVGNLLPKVKAALRGGATFFIEGLSSQATTITGISNFFLRGIKDKATNNLQPNQVSEETRFTALLGDIRLDYGDAPDLSVAPIGQYRYPTTQANDGARHVVFADNPLYLGSRVDVELDGAPTQNSTGDDVEGNGIAVNVAGVPALVPDAAATPLTLTLAPTYFVEVPTGGGLAITDGEHFTVTNGANSVTFEFDSNNALVVGTRTRIPFSLGSTEDGIAASIVAALNAAGLGLTPVNLGGGRVHLGAGPTNTLDASGAPSLISGGGSLNVADSQTFTITKGATTVTFEFDSNFNTVLGNEIIRFDSRLTNEQIADRIAAAILSVGLGVTPLHLGDGVIEMDGDDEDGVTFQGAFNAFLVTPLTVVASDNGLLDAFIDFNRDGDFDDPGEKIFNSVRLVAGENHLTTTTPLTAVPGDTTARFRFSLLGGLGPNGLAASGEVEDYAITIRDGHPPVANNDPGLAGDPNYSTDEDTAIPVRPGVSVLTNDTDADVGTVLQVDSPGTIASVNGATVVLNADGTFSYDGTDRTTARAIQALAQGATLADTFTYRATDGFLFSNIGTVTINVTGVNDAPDAFDLAGISAIEDGAPVTRQLPGDDIDTDDDRTSLTYVINPPGASEGLVVNNNNGTFTFNPQPGVAFQNLALGETRDATFAYHTVDSHGATSLPGTVTITVTGVNDAPTVQNVLVLATEDGLPVNGAFVGNDIDSDDGPGSLVFTLVSGPAEGAFINNNDGTFSFNPGSGFQDLGPGETREVRATYTARDSHGAISLLGTLTARVSGVNDAPIAVNDPVLASAYTTNEDTVLNVTSSGQNLLANDTDPDGDLLTIQGTTLVTPINVTSMAGAPVVINNDGTFSYDPRNVPALQALITGQTITDTFTYRAVDSNGAVSNVAVATVTITGRNDAPTAGPLLITAVEDGPTVTANFNGSDPDAGTPPSSLIYAIVAGSGPGEGRVVNNNNGTFTFDPTARPPLFLDFQDLGVGETRDVFFTYRATDSTGLTGAPGTVTIRVSGVNDAPRAADDTSGINAFNSAINIPVLANDTDIDGDALNLSSVTIVSQGTLGVATPNPNGTVTYTANTGATGTDTFTYTVRDINGAVSNVATVRVTTTHFPVAVDDSDSTFSGTPVTIDVLDNDSDSDGSLVPSSVTIVTSPLHGVATVNSGDGSITYTPNDGYVGPEVIQYTVRDNVGAVSNVATVSIDVVVNATPYRNPRNNLDVNRDGIVTPFDALLVIAHLQLIGPSLPPGPPPPYVDTVAQDNVVTPLDAAAVISFLQLQANSEGEAQTSDAPAEGEGEASPGAFPLDTLPVGAGALPVSAFQTPTTAAQDGSATVDAVLAGALDGPTGSFDDLLDDLATDASGQQRSELADDALLDLLLGDRRRG